MSEQVQETEVVSGVIGGITQKRADTWQVAVTPAGSQYAKNLWTKDAGLVGELQQRLGQTVEFRCVVSHWTNAEGKPVRSLWLPTPEQQMAWERSGGEVAAPAVATASPAQKPTPKGEPDVDWDEKERRAIRSKAWAHTTSILGIQTDHNLSADEIIKVHGELKLMVELIYVDICRSHDFAHPNLGDSASFGAEPDSVPFD